MASSPWQDMEEAFFTCSICLDNFTEPKQLPCLHRFCRGCIKPVIDKADSKFSCPLCKQVCTVPSNGVAGFKTDFHAKNIIEYIQLQKSVTNEVVRKCVGCSQEHEVGAYCFKCKGFLCEQCYKIHETSGMLEDHRGKILALEDIKAKNLTFEKLASLKESAACCEHPTRPAEICCGSCGNVPICMVCGHHEKHKGHELHGVTELAVKERERIEQTLSSLKKGRNIHTLPEEIDAAKSQLMADISAKKEQLQSQYNEEAEKIATKWQESEDALKQYEAEIDEEEKAGVAELETNREIAIQAVNMKYDKLIDSLKEENNQKRAEREAEDVEVKSMLSETQNFLDEEFSELSSYIDQQEEQNLGKFEEISKVTTQKIQQYDNFMSAASSILASHDDWTDVLCLPDVNAAGEPLIDEDDQRFQEIAALSEITLQDITPVNFTDEAEIEEINEPDDYDLDESSTDNWTPPPEEASSCSQDARQLPPPQQGKPAGRNWHKTSGIKAQTDWHSMFPSVEEFASSCGFSANSYDSFLSPGGSWPSGSRRVGANKGGRSGRGGVANQRGRGRGTATNKAHGGSQTGAANRGRGSSTSRGGNRGRGGDKNFSGDKGPEASQGRGRGQDKGHRGGQVQGHHNKSQGGRGRGRGGDKGRGGNRGRGADRGHKGNRGGGH